MGTIFFESTAFQVDIKNQTAVVHFIGNAKQLPQDRKTITAFTHEFPLNMAKNFLQKTKTIYDYGEGPLLFIKTYPNSDFEQSFYKLTRDLLTVSNQPATKITTLANKEDVNELLEEYSQFSIVPIGEHEAYLGVCKDDGEHTKSELLHLTHAGNLYEDIAQQKINFTVVEQQESILPNDHTKI